MSWFDEQPQPQPRGTGGWEINGQPPPQIQGGPDLPPWLTSATVTDLGTTSRRAAQIDAWKQQHPEGWAAYVANGGDPTPPYELGTKFGITDPGQGQNRFLAGDQIGPDGLPIGSPWPGSTNGGITSTPGPYQQPGGSLQSGQSNGNYQQTYQQIMGGANDQASLLAHQDELEAAGFHLSPANASGAISKIQTPDGQWVRVIGEGEGHPVWIPQGGAGTIGSLSGSGGMADGSLIQPWSEQFQAPSPDQIAQDPSYQFQLGQGLQGIERGAAAKGTLLTGGTIKALNNYGQGLASTFSDKYYNRALGEYGLKKQNFQENQDRPFTKLSQLATLGKPQTMQPPTG